MILRDRVDALESAVVAMGRQEFGDVDGHPFHGNQWTGVGGHTEKDREARRERQARVKAERQANPQLGQPPPPKPKPATEAQIWGRRKSIGQHVQAIERATAEAARDMGMSEDEVFHDIAHAYLQTSVRPADRAELRQALGVSARPGDLAKEPPPLKGWQG